MIVEGKKPFDTKRPSLPFHAPVYVYMGRENTMELRATLAIAMCESNDIGGFFFMSLHIGKCLHTNMWQEVHITPDIISQVSNIDKVAHTNILDKYTIPWDQGVTPINNDAENNIQDDLHLPKPTNDHVDEENNISVVNINLFKFNMNNAYDVDIDASATIQGTDQIIPNAGQADGPIPNEDEGSDLDILILDLVARERGETEV